MINNVTLVGRLTKDVELKQTNSGTSVASFSLAVERNRKDQNGNKETDFFDCVAWRGQADVIAKYTQKGSMLGIDGRLEQQRWEDKNGNKRSSVKIVVENLQLFGSGNQNQNQQQNQQPQQQYQPQPYNQPAQQQYQPQQGQMDMSYQQPPQFQPPQDEELPF